jgi:carbonic anhydrase
MKATALFIPTAFILLIAGTVRAQHTAAPAAGPTADAVLAELRAGNDHHAAKQYQHPHETAERQRELTSGQHPHASVLACADSRVPPEIVFDQGLGDLFVIRVAGNVASDDVVGSLEYGAEHLNIPLIVVLGHQKCGGVTAAVEGGQLGGHMPGLVALIQPAVDKTKGMPGDRVANAVRANVEMVVDQLRGSKPLLAELAAAGKIKIVGGVYSLDTGRVDWLR